MNPRRPTPLPKDVMSDPDVVLMLAFKNGDYDAFGVLVERHAKALVNYFFFQSRDMDLAEDCAQEVWVRIFRSRAEYSPRARFRTFLFRVARNFWIDVYRKTGRRIQETSLDADGSGGQESDTGALSSRLAGDDPEPHQQLENAELLSNLARATARLSEEMREVFLLGEVEGLAYAEIGVILDIPIGTVKSRMFNAVRKLREILETGGGNP